MITEIDSTFSPFERGFHNTGLKGAKHNTSRQKRRYFIAQDHSLGVPIGIAAGVSSLHSQHSVGSKQILFYLSFSKKSLLMKSTSSFLSVQCAHAHCLHFKSVHCSGVKLFSSLAKST